MYKDGLYKSIVKSREVTFLSPKTDFDTNLHAIGDNNKSTVIIHRMNLICLNLSFKITCIYSLI